jgi:S-formylglutathione hydrolase FrmB
MALVQVTTFAPSMKRNMGFTALLPEGKEPGFLRTAPVLFLLHGWAGNQFDWLLGSEVARHAQDRGIVVVMPSGENRFYLDDPEMEEYTSRWIVDELPGAVSEFFGIPRVRDRWYLGGYSMGGYGALRNGLAFPDRFGGLIGLSSALITRGIAGMKPGESTPFAGYPYYRRVFGDLEALAGSDRDPEALVARLAGQGGRIPRIYLSCGTEDFLLDDNRSLHRCLEAHGMAHEYHELAGAAHDFAFWNAQLAPALDWMAAGTGPCN